MQNILMPSKVSYNAMSCWYQGQLGKTWQLMGWPTTKSSQNLYTASLPAGLSAPTSEPWDHLLHMLTHGLTSSLRSRIRSRDSLTRIKQSSGRNTSSIYSEICHGRRRSISLHSFVPSSIQGLNRHMPEQYAWPLMQATSTGAVLLPQPCWKEL